MIELDLKPDLKKLRQFGWICLAGFGIFGLLVAWKSGAFEGGGNWTVPAIFWALALVCPVLSVFAPKGLTPIYIGLTLIAFPIGLVVSNLVLALLFFLVFTPLALCFRLMGRDELQRKFDPEAPSYWVRCSAPRDAASYYRQF